MLASTSAAPASSILAFATFALLALAQAPSPVEASSPSSSSSPSPLDFESYVSSRLLSYHAHQASPALSARSISFPSSHRSNPSRFSSSSSSSVDPVVAAAATAPKIYIEAPVVSAPLSAAQVKVARLKSIKSAAKARGFALVKKAPRAIRNAHAKRSLGGERTRATTGQVEVRKRLWVRAEPDEAPSEEEEGEVEEAEGDETAETAGESEDWTWMEENASSPGDEAEDEDDEANLSSAARMEIRMRRTVPLFHRDP
ncbi:hypothetical protein JCM8097_005473 [Rhodosporidiobolus ruineniae]